MQTIKEITVFTIGDSSDLKTWSNVPYFFTQSLHERGIKINRVNIEENRFISPIYKYTIYILLKLFYPKTQHVYFRSSVNYFLTKGKINAALTQYPKADVNLFLTYSFSIKSTAKQKTVLFSDWSYLYKIQELESRQAYWFEKRALQREATHIHEADVVFSLFPKSKQFILDNFEVSSCFYLGNVINNNQSIHKEELIQAKLKSNRVLFIGNKKYLQGAIDLINACKAYNNKHIQPIELHVIGLTKEDIAIDFNNLFCYGYLDKGDKKQSDNYYQQLQEAKVIINTTANWGGFSSMTEAMYFYTPVITTPYNEFVETYGEKLTCGFYATNQHELLNRIEQLFSADIEQYSQWMNSAHEAVKGFTWNNYIQKFLDKIT